MQRIIHTYEKRFDVKPLYFLTPPKREMALVVAIPAFKEPDILPTLQSLAACEPPSGTVEIILVINASEQASDDVLEINEGTYRQAVCWAASHKPDFIDILVIREDRLPHKSAGAGLARKIAMDEALRRWGMVGKDGPILCLDADCAVSEDYFVKAEEVFANDKIKLAHFGFLHKWKEEPDSRLQRGILCYELHLRCFIQGLVWAGYPFAVHTVGSCMAVRASAYAKSGGMNKRKAGEDFYFMHKLLPLAGFSYIDATVYPSSRVSDRVPFGTGRAQLEWLARERQAFTYHVEIYKQLALVFCHVQDWYIQEPTEHTLPEVLRPFLASVGLCSAIDKMKSQSNSLGVFLRRFWQWMDGFMVLKMVHFLRDNGFPNQPISEVAAFFHDPTNSGQDGFSIDPLIGELLAEL